MNTRVSHPHLGLLEIIDGCLRECNELIVQVAFAVDCHTCQYLFPCPIRPRHLQSPMIYTCESDWLTKPTMPPEEPNQPGMLWSIKTILPLGSADEIPDNEPTPTLRVSGANTFWNGYNGLA